MFSSRDDYERVIRALLVVVDRLADLVDADDRARAAPELDDVHGDLVVRWTAAQLALADRYTLDVTERPGGWGYPPGGWPDGRPPPLEHAPSATLELRLRRDDGWNPAYADDVEEDDR